MESTQPKHTGWYVKQLNSGFFAVAEEVPDKFNGGTSTRYITNPLGDYWNKDNADKQKHEAHLIAAAPELLEVLVWVTKCAKIKTPYGGYAYCISDEKMQEAINAIAKAEGRA